MKKALILLASILMIGCYTEKKAQNQISKAVKKQPKIAAESLRKSFPCITKSDTIRQIDTGYDFIEIQCPDQVPAVTKIDTIVINKVTKDKVYLPGKIVKVGAQKETITITKIVKDSAEIFLAQQQAKECSENVNRLQSKIEKRNTWIISFLIALLISLLFNVLQWKQK